MLAVGEPVARFVSEQLGFALCPPWTAMGIERDGRIIGGVLFNQFEGADVAVTIAGTGWTRSFIEAVDQYVFGQLGCLRMTATTEYPEVVAYAQRLGGQVEGRLRNHFGPSRDGIIVGILKEEWRRARLPQPARLNSTSRASERGSDRESAKSS
jgi:RimJ/RimL family protein N-acetyltransferase